MNIVEHVESFFGKISHGWKDEGSDNGIQVVCIQNSPLESVDTFITLGLSNHILNITESKKVRQELIFPVSGSRSHFVVHYLFSVCRLLLKNHKAIVRGEVIRLQNDLAGELGFDAMYCAIPVFMEDGFATLEDSDPPTVMVWVIPIHEIEADFIENKGWNIFEDILEEQKPDLFSLKREPVI